MPANRATGVTFEPSRIVLDNGVTLMQQENPASPAVSISVRLAAGSAFESAETAGLAAFCAAMLKRGTGRRSKEEIGETLDFTGALLAGAATWHTAGVGAKSRAADFAEILELVAECVMMPSFPVPEVEKLRGDIITAIQEDRDDTRQVCMDRLRAAIYPDDHPYAWRLSGTEETIRRLTRDELDAFHRKHFGPGGAVVVVVGAVEAGCVEEAVAGTFGGWTADTGAQGPDGGGLPASLPNVPEAPLLGQVERVVETMPSKSQADVAIGHRAFRRKDDDYYAAVVMNMILGQFAMGGRLGRNIREEQGLAYAAHSSFGATVGPGPFVVRVGVHPNNVDVAIDSVFEEIEKIRSDPVGEEELANAKSAIVRSLPRTLETNAGMASVMLVMEQYQLGLDYLERYPDLIGAIDVDRVQDVAARRLHPDRCGVAIAGPYPVEENGTT